MKRILMIAGLMITLCNVTLGVVYAECSNTTCFCRDATGGCRGDGVGAYCGKDANGWCQCKDGPPRPCHDEIF